MPLRNYCPINHTISSSPGPFGAIFSCLASGDTGREGAEGEGGEGGLSGIRHFPTTLPQGLDGLITNFMYDKSISSQIKRWTFFFFTKKPSLHPALMGLEIH